ncbi:snaclec convulxin subunit beta-like [Sabethes cyaneus]|uniref:snaclec convulxin subunit beta-like n=1 Tax=Sabethes cyaneus TaxID=53552 RepID=UPI00237D4833|nr:snaclec convulxin subunit beta-like [Sabethes cyaneus]
MARKKLDNPCLVTVGNINRENLDFLKKECDANAPMAVPNFKANWFKATEYCHYLGRNLVTVTSAEKQAIVNKILEETDKYGDNSFWIGGSDLADLGNFHWHSTGTRIVWHNWNELLALPTAEDARKDDRCVLLANQTDKRGFKWVVANCWDEYYFVCEQKIGVGSPITFPS